MNGGLRCRVGEVIEVFWGEVGEQSQGEVGNILVVIDMKNQYTCLGVGEFGSGDFWVCGFSNFIAFYHSSFPLFYKILMVVCHPEALKPVVCCMCWLSLQQRPHHYPEVPFDRADSTRTRSRTLSFLQNSTTPFEACTSERNPVIASQATGQADPGNLPSGSFQGRILVQLPQRHKLVTNITKYISGLETNGCPQDYWFFCRLA